MKKRKSFWALLVSLFVGSSACTESNTNEENDVEQDSMEPEVIEFGNNYGGKLIPINTLDYSRYLMVQNTSIEYVLNAITEFGELSGGSEFIELEFGIIKYENWTIVKVADKLGFYEFHNLVGWLWGYGEGTEIPTMTYGLALHRIDSTKSYYLELDKNTPDGDIVVGAFMNGDTHYIFLPEAFAEEGNMKISSELKYDYLTVQEIFIKLGLRFDDFSSQLFQNNKVKYYR